MKKQGLKVTIVFLLITTLLIPLMSQTATKLSVLDTRNINTGPNGFSSEAKIEFKSRSAIGVPGTGTYSGLLTIAPWMLDNSGNKHHQLNFNDGGIYYRTGLPQDATWGSWSKLVLEDTNGNLTFNGSVKGNLTGGALRIQTTSGYLDLGGLNSYWAHIYTDLPNFLFNKGVYSLTGYFGSHPGNNLNFRTNGTDRMTILNSNGNIGIGISTPAYKLDVAAGDMRISNYSPTICLQRNASSGGFIQGIQTKLADGTDHWYFGVLNNNWIVSKGDFNNPKLTILDNGKVGLGTSDIPSDFTLAVAGKIIAEEVVVQLQNTWWSDYVFEPDYDLMPLHKVEQFVQANKHLPGIPSASEVKNDGLSMGEMQNKLLQKIEELTLYMIEQGKTINQQSAKIKELEERLK